LPALIAELGMETKTRAGTPIAVESAGTLDITRLFAAMTERSPIVTAPMMLE
jgi:hypothetical protein